MKIYWDLDGVLRDLSKIVFGKDPTEWGAKTDDRLSIFDAIRKDPRLLIDAPTTEYLPVALKQKSVHILTCQPDNWKTLTELWIATHLKDIDVLITFSETSQGKLAMLEGGDYLIEDYPLFSDYKNIILIDRAYNRNVNAPIRVHTPEQLERIIDER
jgi:hypothetical protein